MYTQYSGILPYTSLVSDMEENRLVLTDTLVVIQWCGSHLSSHNFEDVYSTGLSIPSEEVGHDHMMATIN